MYVIEVLDAKKGWVEIPETLQDSKKHLITEVEELNKLVTLEVKRELGIVKGRYRIKKVKGKKAS